MRYARSPLPGSVLVLLLAVSASASRASAQAVRPVQAAPAAPRASADTTLADREPPDPTRLDVERLPPEAIAVKRDMYAHGFFLDSGVGGRGFAGALGRLSLPGMFARVAIGYEFTDWLLLTAGVELSLHETSAPAPPNPANFELINPVAQLRLQLPLSARFAPWLAGEAGIGWVPGNLLSGYGVNDAGKVGLNYGGSVGVDWHMLNRHYSLGLLAGARLYPNLAGLNNEATLGIHSAVYLKYVF